MAWVVKINSLAWVADPSGNQTVFVSYREGGTAGAFTASGAIFFASDGTISGTPNPYIISGISDAWASIEVDFVNQCSMVDYLQTFTKPA